MIRVAAIIPNPNDGTAYYRATSPLAHLQRSGHIQVNAVKEVNTPMAHFYDLAFFQRPTSETELGAMQIFKRMDIPIVVDYDDDLLEVPADNPTFFQYADPQCRANYLNAIQAADLITVSTAGLRKKILDIYPHKRVYVVKNGLDERLFNVQGEATDQKVLWRGSFTHQRDLYTFRKELDTFINNHSITFMGYFPWFLENQNFEVKPPVYSSITEYFAKLRALQPTIGIVPLHDSHFNRCKSNIAWLEMAWAGAVCLVPNWDEWRVPGVTTYESPSEFLQGLDWLVNLSAEETRSMRLHAWTEIQEKFTLQTINRLRLSLFEALTRGYPWPEN